ncbi:LysR family transcriptional regulator [Parasedimentitalea maritima]|uniref:LysR family transcriptional regulator n=1 Tax=Parasedimentitalea maritima TaxID=2578117 RepID=A0ABY2UYD5_9RHOB|nr:LysR family transcriptional regulator [Zongyanglinia marina]TLP64265.1 LysR family transcriptional regulator [Zongyanglinia marina]
MRNLPSLNGLRAFEVAARCGSFVLAGNELGVSSAAVSLQVKSLEDHLGKKLFLRKGNRISLTDAGEEMYPKLAHAFSELSDAAQIVRSNKRSRQLVVSVLPALSELWFLPKALEFSNKTGICLDIRVQEDPIDFERESIDVRLTFGSVFYPEYRQTPLFSDLAIPVCAPSFWARHSDPEGMLTNVPDAKLIHNKWGPSYASEPLWLDWRREAGTGGAALTSPGFVLSDTSLAISAAKQGAGIALAPSILVSSALFSGSLVSPSSVSLPMKKDYVCIYPNARAEAPAVRLFLKYLDLD